MSSEGPLLSLLRQNCLSFCNFSARKLVPEHLSDHLFILFHPVCYASESFLINVSIRTTQDISNHSYKKNIDFKIASSLKGPYFSSFLFFFFFRFFFFFLIHLSLFRNDPQNPVALCEDVYIISIASDA